MKKFIKSSYFAIILLFIYVPIAVMMFFSFNSGKTLSSFEGYSTEWYSYFLSYSPFVKSIIVSLFVAMVSTIISVVIGVMACVGLARIKRRQSNNWVRVANIPLVNADVITAVGLMLLFVIAGLKFGAFTLIAAHVSFNVPYVIITVLPFMLRLDKNILEASKDLGGTPTKTFFKVVLPILTPCIITASAICFAMSFDDFIISYFTGGGQTNVSTFIYTAKKMQPYINAFGTVLVAVILFVIIIWNAVHLSFQKANETKNQIKKDEYKIKKISQLKKKIAYYNKCVETNTVLRRSMNIFKWINYGIISLEVKRLNAINHNAKISKLEWKLDRISNEIKEESRLQTIHAKLTLKKSQLNSKLALSKNEKRNKKLSLLLSKLDKKISYYEKELDWIKERDSYDKELANDLIKQINNLKEEKNSLQNPSQSLITWYDRKIAKLTIKKDQLIEGRNNFKLRSTIEKIQAVKLKTDEKIAKKYQMLEEAKWKVFKKVSFSNALDKAIIKLEASKNKLSNYQEKLASYEERKSKVVDSKLAKIFSNIKKNNEKLENIMIDTEKKKAKYFPDVLSADYISTRNRWFKRNWKQLSMGTILLGSFSLVTTAYIMNNIYDLVIGNWGSYIDPKLLAQFESENNVKINYQQYDSNESLYNKNYTFNYDIMVPSDYMVKKMAEENMLQEIDWCKIENIKTPKELLNKKECSDKKDENATEAINDALQETMALTTVGKNEDLNILSYSVPYVWGDVRIVFNLENENVLEFLKSHNEGEDIASPENNLIYQNTDTQPEAEGWILNENNLSWNILWEAAQENLNVALNEDPKNVFMYAFEKLYGNVESVPNKEDNKNLPSRMEQIDKAAEAVIELLKPRNVGVYGDQLMDKVHDGDYDIAVMYNGDVLWSLSPDYESEGGEEDSLSKQEASAEGDEEENAETPKVITGVPGAKSELNKDKNQQTNIFSDDLVISKSNRNIDLTYKFINFIYSHESQMAIVEETSQTSPLQSVIDKIQEGYGKDSLYAKWFLPSKKGEPFGFNEELDNYLVDRYNNIIATKI